MHGKLLPPLLPLVSQNATTLVAYLFSQQLYVHACPLTPVQIWHHFVTISNIIWSLRHHSRSGSALEPIPVNNITELTRCHPTFPYCRNSNDIKNMVSPAESENHDPALAEFSRIMIWSATCLSSHDCSWLLAACDVVIDKGDLSICTIVTSRPDSTFVCYGRACSAEQSPFDFDSIKPGTYRFSIVSHEPQHSSLVSLLLTVLVRIVIFSCQPLSDDFLIYT